MDPTLKQRKVPWFGTIRMLTQVLGEKEMLDHLESVLANEPVSVKSGKFIVEVKPQVRSSILKDLQILVLIDEDMSFMDTIISLCSDTKTSFKYGKLVLILFHQVF
jgi:hypothetical protein